MKLKKIHNVSRKDFIWFLVIIILCGISFIRPDKIGSDLAVYKRYYYEFAEGKPGLYEPAFILLMRIQQFICVNFRMFMIVCSAITILSILLVAKKEVKKEEWITILAFITFNYIPGFSILRGYLALASLFLAYGSIEEKNNKIVISKKSYMYMAFSVLFHYSSFLFILIFFMGRKKYVSELYIIAVFFAVCLNFPGIPYLITQLMATIRSRYISYISHGGFNISTVYLCIYGAVFWLMERWRRREKKLIGKRIVLYNMCFFMLVFSVAGGWFPGYTRILQMGTAFLILTLPIAVSVPSKNKKWIVTGMIMVSVAFWILNYRQYFNI